MNDLGIKSIGKDGVITYLYAKYFVSGYAGPKHKTAPIGTLLLTTRNIGSSKDAEVAAWKARMERGEVSRIEVSLNDRIVETYYGNLRAAMTRRG